jgi:hypothetical protein
VWRPERRLYRGFDTMSTNVFFRDRRQSHRRNRGLSSDKTKHMPRRVHCVGRGHFPDSIETYGGSARVAVRF